MILLWFGLFLSVFGLEFKDQTMDKPNLARFMLPPDKDYMDWWKLTPENYNERVLESVDAWIVAIHPKNQQPEVWRKMAPRYRGQIFFGKLQDDVINEDMKKKYKYDGRPIVSKDNHNFYRSMITDMSSLLDINFITGSYQIVLFCVTFTGSV